MSRQAKWWEHEQPVVTTAGDSLIVEHFPKAGVLQFFNVIPSAANGRSRGVVVHLDKLPVGALAQIRDAVNAAVGGEAQVRAATAPKGKKKAA